MPLLELTILEIHSFPHFSLTCFDILSSNFAHDFVILYYRSSLSVVNFRQVLCELCPFCNLQYWKYTVFRTFLIHALTYSAEILHMTLLSPRNALQRGYSNAAVVPSVCVCVCPCVCPSRFDLVNTIETEPLCASSSNLADMFTMTRG